MLVAHTHTHKISCHTSAHTFSLLRRPSWTSPTHIHAGSFDLQPGRCHKHTDKTISIISRVCQDVTPQPRSHYHCFSIYSGSLNKRPRASWPRVITISTPTHTDLLSLSYHHRLYTFSHGWLMLGLCSGIVRGWNTINTHRKSHVWRRLAAVKLSDRKAGNIATILGDCDDCKSKTFIFIYICDKKRLPHISCSVTLSHHFVIFLHRYSCKEDPYPYAFCRLTGCDRKQAAVRRSEVGCSCRTFLEMSC